jgi:hypothetical protein
MLEINCILVTNDCKIGGGPFIIDLPPNLRVGALQEEVKTKKGPGHIPDIIPADVLIPWKLHTPFPGYPPGDLASHVDGLNLNSEDDDRAATLLNPLSRLQKYFPEEPPLEVVHIVIQLPPEPSLVEGGLDLPRVEAEHDTYDDLIIYLGASRYVLDAPSTMSKPNMFQDYQGTDNRILNDRPSKDVNVPPLALLYPPFGRFIDDLHPKKKPAMNLQTLQFAVEAFGSVMCKHFQDGKDRQKAVLEALYEIFRSYGQFSLPPIVPDKIAGERVSSGHANGPAQVMETVVGIQNEFGSGNTDPEIQYTSCFMQMNNSQIRFGTHKKSFEKHLCPTLGITIVGMKTGFFILFAFSFFFQVHTSHQQIMKYISGF